MVDFEIENTMLIRELEASGEDGRCGSGARGLESEPMEWGQHGEFQLKGITTCGNERNPLIPRVFGHLNIISLHSEISIFPIPHTEQIPTTSFFTR